MSPDSLLITAICYPEQACSPTVTVLTRHPTVCTHVAQHQRLGALRAGKGDIEPAGMAGPMRAQCRVW